MLGRVRPGRPGAADHAPSAERWVSRHTVASRHGRAELSGSGAHHALPHRTTHSHPQRTQFVSLRTLRIEKEFGVSDVASLAGCFPLLEVPHQLATPAQSTFATRLEQLTNCFLPLFVGTHACRRSAARPCLRPGTVTARMVLYPCFPAADVRGAHRPPKRRSQGSESAPFCARAIRKAPKATKLCGKQYQTQCRSAGLLTNEELVHPL